jgi:choline dehydrogenase-like flavoprotein
VIYDYVAAGAVAESGVPAGRLSSHQALVLLAEAGGADRRPYLRITRWTGAPEKYAALVQHLRENDYPN